MISHPLIQYKQTHDVAPNGYHSFNHIDQTINTSHTCGTVPKNLSIQGGIKLGSSLDSNYLIYKGLLIWALRVLNISRTQESQKPFVSVIFIARF